MRELTPFVGVSLDPKRDFGVQLSELIGSIGFKKSEEYFLSYPPHSLLSARIRAYLNQLILAMKPNYVLEIGTYMAGTAEVIARSLWAAGKGRLVTIDPFGAERVPGEIAKWPEALQKIVDFFPEMSMQFFADTIKRAGYTFDVVFIDGNHEYEVVFHDLLMSARYLNPRGVIVLDNAEQPGVLWAAKQFLALNPGWTEISGTLGAYSPDHPYNLVDLPLNTLRTQTDGVMALILLAPWIQIGERPVSYECQFVDARDVESFVLRIAEPSGSGTLHAKTCLRTFAHEYAVRGLEPEELVIVQNRPVRNAEGEIKITFNPPLKSAKYSEIWFQRCELTLSWRPAPPQDIPSGLRTLFSGKQATTNRMLKLGERPCLFPQRPGVVMR